jgi:hypothetical protein
MNASAVPNSERRSRSLRLWLLIAAALALVLAANAHLVYVATISQPACVAHLRQGEVRQGEGGAGRGQFSAAQSSCSTVKEGTPS